MLRAWREGDASALDRLTPIVYSELHRLASFKMADERVGHVLNPSALVNEAFVRLMADTPVEWSSRAHFFAFSARLMRQILVDFARAEQTIKRGNRSPHVDLSGIEDLPAKQPRPIDLIDLDNALLTLSKVHPRQAEVVQLRYFGGLENAEAAEVLGIAENTVMRDWRFARAWLYSRLHLPPPTGSQPGEQPLQ